MRLASILTALLFIICGAALKTQAQTPASISKEKEEAIRHLLEITKSPEMSRQIIEQAIIGIKEDMAEVPKEQREKILQIVEEEMRKDFSVEKIIEAVIPIYDKHLSLEEVKQLIALYETPIGKKILTVVPQIISEAQKEGEKIGERTSQRIEARLWAEGLLTPPEKEAQPPQAKTARPSSAKPTATRKGRRRP